MFNPEDIARELSRMIPKDGDDGSGQMHPAWEAANLHAAQHLSENIEKYRRMTTDGSRSNEFAYIMAREGRKLRNEYLAGRAGG